MFYQFPSFPGTAIEKILGFVNFHRTWNNQPQSYHQTRTGTGLFNVCHIFFWGLVCFCLYSTGEYLCNFYKNIYGPICYFLRFLPLSMPFSTELSFNLFVKRKNVLESQMTKKSGTWKKMTWNLNKLSNTYGEEVICRDCCHKLWLFWKIPPVWTKITMY